MGAAKVVHAGHGATLLISEVQVTGGAGKTTHDFVELYNPTGVAVDLNGIRLVKRTATGTADTTLKSWTEVALVPAHSYYLWANSAFTTIGVTPDATTSGTLADNNGVALRRGAENTGEILDAVAWGTVSNVFVEGAPFTQNPSANQSLERKPDGGEGNGTDTNNNAADFFLQSAPNPKNSASAAMPVITPTPPESSPQAGEENKSISPPAGGGAGGGGSNPGDIVINEFLPDPLAGSDEWVELYNRTSAALDLTGWKLQDGTANTIKTLSGTLSASGFLVVELTSARLNNSGDRIMLRAPPLSPPSQGGDSVGVLIDGVSYGDWNDGNIADNAPAPTRAGQAVARKSNGADTSSDKEDFALTDSPTSSSGNVIAVSTVVTVGGGSAPSSTVVVPNPKIVINEFVSDPEDGPEWVELYNAGEVSVDLDEWWLEDGSETKTKLSGTLVPGHFKVVRDIAGNLNNKGDILRLKNNKGEVIDRVSYGVWEDGTVSDNAPVAEDPYSVARRKDGIDTDNDAADFAVTAKMTKGKENIIEEIKRLSDEAIKEEKKNVAEVIKAHEPTLPPPLLPLPNPFIQSNPPTPEILLADLRDLDLGTKVRTQGVVSAPPGILGTQIFYIAGSGIQIYSSKRAFPELKLGDIVKVEGVLGEAQSERRIKVKEKEDMEVVGQGVLPVPQEIVGEELSEELEGTLVRLSGTLIDVTRNQMVLDDSQNEITVSIKKTTDIDTREFAPGMELTITGIVVPDKTAWRILPRWKKDVEIVKGTKGTNEPKKSSVPSIPSGSSVSSVPSSSSNSHPYAEATAYAGGGGALAAAALRRRKLLGSAWRTLAFLLRRSRGNGLS